MSSNHLTFEGGLARCVTNVVKPSVKQPRLGDTRCGMTTFVTLRCGEGLKLPRIDDVCNKIWARQPSEAWSTPVERCHLFVSFGLGYALSWSVSSSCWAAWGVVPVFSRSISPCDKGASLPAALSGHMCRARWYVARGGPASRDSEAAQACHANGCTLQVTSLGRILRDLSRG